MGGREKPNNEINLPTAFMFNECRPDLFSICLQIFPRLRTEYVLLAVFGATLSDRVGARPG